MEGILLVDKPSGWTSFDVVNYIRKIVAVAESKKPKNCKVGHIGTLDPLATGLLVLLIGKEYTRRASELAKLDKIYEVEMTLGVTSTTGDNEGEKLQISSRQPPLLEIKKTLQKFTGEISQIPPAYSAIKVNGRRAYELARAGEQPKMEPRKITIYSLKLSSYDYPRAKFTTKVSSGTYIRSLVEDIGEELKTGAYTSALRRVKIGKYDIKSAVDLQEIDILSRLKKL